MADIVAVALSIKTGLPEFLIHTGVTMLLWLVSWRFALIAVPVNRKMSANETDVAQSMLRSGEAIAFAIPLAACLSASVNAADVLLWGLVVAMLQLGFSFACSWWVASLAKRSGPAEAEKVVMILSLRIGFALICAAAVTG